ncbi:1-(5-phosphoribosyl)-5-[(5-phosphoribosylamino)methylideneamino]imidazole-4-carboxamide isomerase [Robiginitalea sp. M366]|uniref:1-(5-phosphoribosyl)-5-[(5- phosphoribosylamino)methylideneamino]imidazole-4- carboxamide isomerase n=1 Tax=Robiginitalea aestuariiviva TaxID=3036903 RepID=UPI00240E909B|nr:1-(5-phosphoribosyl)-5-[(5-phosphoribosylamino)methylideneamino]imidazole-4-carboxamide isomerase [Robiginitalea aestuariiviva]MDG1572961.1 1-(5-phosphoribosyl)-5-[(5-phosphoribosylamino)methylideneamino]imidazole-4-carboxamide isomerase [Robiginitalea aestuariiviva]
MRIIPAIDLIGGKCVRLTQGDYGTAKTYSDDPLEMAKAFEDHGIRHLHLVDLDGAKASHIVNHKVLERIAGHTGLSVDFGGGLKSDEDLRIAFESGARQITGGSIAVKDPDRFLGWLRSYGPERIILGADARDGRIAVSGWQEESALELEPFILEYLGKGVHYVICTDIGRDGMLQGPAMEAYQGLLQAAGGQQPGGAFHLIASGGISRMEDLEQLRELGCEGAIVGKAIYEGHISLTALEKWNT